MADQRHRAGRTPAAVRRLDMTGEIRLGSWHDFEARQILAPPSGFPVATATKVGPLPIRGFDRYVSGSGEMNWRLLGLIPVMSASGADITRSAAGRLAAEMVLIPSTALAPEVTPKGVVVSL